VSSIIDSDQHLYETRTLWRDYIDPGMRAEALPIEDDSVGTPLLRWRDQTLSIARVSCSPSSYKFVRLGSSRTCR
jgi:hypothetical protein